MSPATVPLVLMSVASPLAVVDVLYFHIYRFRLYRHPGSAGETVTHLVRGVIFCSIALLIVYFEPRGAWYWVIAALVALDFANNVADVLLEPRSRATLGGVPPLEYLIHVVGASLSGAAGGGWLVAAWPLANRATALARASELPTFVTVGGVVLSIGGLLLTSFELALFCRASCRARGRPTLSPGVAG
jgi:hypothetical protein